MDLSLALPASPSTSNSSSADSPTMPRTPETPASALHPMLTEGAVFRAAAAGAGPDAAAGAKRKPSRRANTAERRATHNAVERQRRETLNSRFLDLAALLPNLSQIRRPSKSAIVNSSIAHVHAAKRHRFLAQRELRILKLEADSLRREINQWRDRAGLPGIDEPARSEAFALVINGEMEFEPDLSPYDLDGGAFVPGAHGLVDLAEEGEYDDEDDYMPQSHPQSMHAQMVPQQQQQQQQQQMMAQATYAPGMVASPSVEAGNPFAHSLPTQAQVSAGGARGGPALGIRTNGVHHAVAAQQQQMMSPVSATFDGSMATPIGAYDPHRLNPHGHPAHYAGTAAHTSHYVGSPHGSFHIGSADGAATTLDWAAYAALKQQQQQQEAQQPGMYTPPASAHGGAAPAEAAFLRQQQQILAMQQQRAFGSPVDAGADDASLGSTPGSAHGIPIPGGRARAGSSASRARGMSVGTTNGWDGVPSPMGAIPPMKNSPAGSIAMGVGAAMAVMY